ncbi:MAG: hypothetical protein ACI9F2_000278 [Lysobacterales bacterium]|jgi:hypothetical protein
MKKISLFILCFSLFLNNPSFAVMDHNHSSPATHGPIGVMADHMHEQGEWMVSYRYMNMHMNQHYAGSTKLSIADVHSDYMIAPLGMTMEMHMVGAMYGLTDNITLMGMVPYHFKTMEHSRRTDGRRFTTRTEGLGDVKLTGMFSLKRWLNKKVQLNVGVSVPTGSIGERGTTFLGSDRKLPYPMQLGSGTVDLLPGLTYSDISGDLNWGAQVSSTIRNGRNELKYQLGDRNEMTAWVGYKLVDWMNVSFRVQASKWGNITGADSELNINMVQTADPSNQGGERIDLFVGTNIVIPKGVLVDHRLALEVGMPAYVYLEGPQLGADIEFTLGWQKAF